MIKDPQAEAILNREFIHEAYIYVPVIAPTDSICYCEYCNGYKIREDIKHYKVLVTDDEYLLVIDPAKNRYGIVHRDISTFE